MPRIGGFGYSSISRSNESISSESSQGKDEIREKIEEAQIRVSTLNDLIKQVKDRFDVLSSKCDEVDNDDTVTDSFKNEMRSRLNASYGYITDAENASEDLDREAKNGNNQPDLSFYLEGLIDECKRHVEILYELEGRMDGSIDELERRGY